MKTTILILLSLCLITACDDGSTLEVQHQRQQQLYSSMERSTAYWQDGRTHLCFAYDPFHWDKTNVPCTPEVLALIKQAQ